MMLIIQPLTVVCVILVFMASHIETVTSSLHDSVISEFTPSGDDPFSFPLPNGEILTMIPVGVPLDVRIANDD